MTTSNDSHTGGLPSSGSNLFLDCLLPYVNYADIPAVMVSQPLIDPDVIALKPADRERYLERLDATFIPSRMTLDVTAGIQLLLRRSLEIRNPNAQGQKQFINAVGFITRAEQFERMPAQPGAGMLISGITGTGKSSVVRRSLEVLCPSQVVRQPSSPEKGWLRLDQCVYLQIDFPSNGTRGALLKRILLALDEQLGTKYFEQHEKKTNIDSLLVVVCKQLVLHRVAILSIDEKQESNFLESCWTTDFLNFYLSLMNLGISVVLIGNPLAFKVFHTFAQNLRRFSVGGIFEFLPAKPNDKWWKEDFVPHARRASLVDGWQVDPDMRASIEFELSAGLPGFFMQMQKELMREALRRGGDTATVSAEDYIKVRSSPRFEHILRISKQLNSAASVDTGAFTDLPMSLPSLKATAAQTPATPGNFDPGPGSVEHVKKMVRKHHASQQKELKKIAEEALMLASLPKEDARLQGTSAEHVRGLRTLEKSVAGYKCG